MNILNYCSLTAVLLVSFFGISQVSSVDLQCVTSTYTNSQYATTGYNRDGRFISGTSVGKSGSVYFQRSFLVFDTPRIPTGKKIKSATLILNAAGSIIPSNPFQVVRINRAWSGGGVTHLNQPVPSLNSVDKATNYTIQGSSLNFDVTDLTEKIYEGMFLDYGFVLQVSNENYQGTTGAAFYSNDHSNVNLRPVLRVEYYEPLSLSNISIQHNVVTGGSDGVIDLSVSGGSGNYTYEWIDGATENVIGTNAMIDRLSSGWYGVKITDGYGDTFYKSFLIGVYGEVTSIAYRPSRDFSENALLKTSQSSSMDYASLNYANNSTIEASTGSFRGFSAFETKSLMKFNLHLESDATISSANLFLNGSSHYGTNEVNVFRVNQAWKEKFVNWNTVPSTSSTATYTIPTTTSSSQDATINVLSDAQNWLSGANNGFLFALKYPSTNNVKQSYTGFGSSLLLRPTLNIDFKPHKTIRASWDEISGMGSIDVDVTGLGEGPYKYTLTRNEILNITTELQTISDSLGLDYSILNSLTIDSNVHSFENLNIGVYQLGVFDKNNIKILSEEVSIIGNPQIYSSNGLTIEKENIIKGDINGSSGFVAHMVSDKENSSLEIELLESVSGESFFGFNDVSDTIASIENIQVGFVVRDGKLKFVHNGVEIGSEEDVNLGDVVRLDLNNVSANYYLNNQESINMALPLMYTFQTVAKLAPYSKGKYKPYYGTFPLLFLPTTQLTYGSCNGSFGVVDLQFGNGSIFLPNSNFSSTLVDHNGVQMVGLNTGSNSNNHVYENLIPGEYTLTYNWDTWSWSGGAWIPNQGSKTVVIEAGVQWSNKNGTIEGSNGIVISSNSSLNSWGTATAYHTANLTEPSNVYFDVDYGALFSINYLGCESTQPSSLSDLGTGFIFIKWGANRFVKGIQDGNIDPSTVYVSANDRFNISLDNNNLTLKKRFINNAYFPITGLPTLSTSDDKFHVGLLTEYGQGFTNVSTDMACNDPLIYAKLKRKMTGVNYKVYLNKVKFYFNEEYLSVNGTLSYNIYSVLDPLNPVLSSVTNSTDMMYNHGDNRFQMDVSTLSEGVYTLVVENTKHEKFYLRFKK